MVWRKSSLALLLTCSILPALERFELTEPHMGTLFRIVLYAPDEAAARAGFGAAFRRVHELDLALSDYRNDSELNRVCREAVERPIAVSEDLFRVLSMSQAMARETKGAFDVTQGPVIRLWRESRRNHRLPAPETLQEARQRSGFHLLRLNPHDRTVRLSKPDMQLDLGGIAKGFAADEALTTLKRLGISHALIAASGDIVTGDAPPGQDGWRVNWLGSEAPLHLTNAALSTSGDTEQYVEIDGQRYSHIIDPRTGNALTTHGTVSVRATRGICADAWATAMSVQQRSGLQSAAQPCP